MAKKLILNRKNVNVEIRSWYCLGGDYLRFPDNPLDGAEYSNVDVIIRTALHDYGSFVIESRVIHIIGQEPIDCELVSFSETSDGKLVINICQDWG